MTATLPFSDAGRGRPLLALHGNYSSRRFWAALLAAPPDGWRVVAPDSPGYAGTPALEHTSPATLADAVERFADTLRLDRPAVLGHSLGGAVALELVSRDPGRYAALILACSPPPTGFPYNPAGDALRDLIPTNRALLEQVFAAQAPGLDAAARARYDWNALLDDAQALTPAVGNGVSRALGEWNVRDRVPAMRDTPTLVLGGALDVFVTPDVTREAAAQLPHARLEWFDDAGHWLPLERPERFRATLSAFLEENA